jgi:hypothetical protein
MYLPAPEPRTGTSIPSNGEHSYWLLNLAYFYRIASNTALELQLILHMLSLDRLVVS